MRSFGLLETHSWQQSNSVGIKMKKVLMKIFILTLFQCCNMSDALMKTTSWPSGLTIKLSYILQVLLMLEFTGQKNYTTKIWALLSVEKGTTSIHFWVKWLCSSRGCLLLWSTAIGNADFHGFFSVLQLRALKLRTLAHQYFSIHLCSSSAKTSFSGRWVWKKD